MAMLLAAAALLPYAATMGYEARRPRARMLRGGARDRRRRGAHRRPRRPRVHHRVHRRGHRAGAREDRSVVIAGLRPCERCSARCGSAGPRLRAGSVEVLAAAGARTAAAADTACRTPATTIVDEVDAELQRRRRRPRARPRRRPPRRCWPRPGSWSPRPARRSARPTWPRSATARPAMPATKATKNEKKPGSEMKLVSGWCSGSKLLGRSRPSRSKNSVASERRAAMPSGKPDRQRAQRAPGQVARGAPRAPRRGPRAGRTPGRPPSPRRSGSAGPARMPADGDQHRQHHEGQEGWPTARCSRRLRCSTSSHTTASDGSPGACSLGLVPRPRRAACRSKSSVIDPVSGMSSSRRSWMTTLASSRATSARITSPSGFSATPGRWITLDTERSPAEQLQRPARPRPAGRRSAGGSRRRRGHVRLQRRPHVVRDRLLVASSGSMNTWRSSPSASSVPSRRHLDAGGHPGGPQPADRGRAARSRRRSGRRPGSGGVASATTMSVPASIIPA